MFPRFAQTWLKKGIQSLNAADTLIGICYSTIPVPVSKQDDRELLCVKKKKKKIPHVLAPKYLSYLKNFQLRFLSPKCSSADSILYKLVITLPLPSLDPWEQTRKSNKNKVLLKCKYDSQIPHMLCQQPCWQWEDPGVRGATDLVTEQAAGPGDPQALKGALCYLTSVAGCWLPFLHRIVETCLSTQ